MSTTDQQSLAAKLAQLEPPVLGPQFDKFVSPSVGRMGAQTAMLEGDGGQRVPVLVVSFNGLAHCLAGLN